ncbi:MAG TPA: GDSL-type esterase/lipase family protein [Solirubrobacteraceae bacterium]|nr:GDSL-type esterase/lipase family protein [Solirubrobacteraceae bacterium]
MDKQRRSRTDLHFRLACVACATALIAAAVTQAAASATHSAISSAHGQKTPCASLAPVSTGEVGALTLSASTSMLGCIGLTVHGATAPSVTVAETPSEGPVYERPATVEVHEGTASVDPAPIWRCDRPTRSFRVTEVSPDGTEQSASTSVSTPSCAKRLSARLLPQRWHRGHQITIALRDRWDLGDLHVEACLDAPHAHSCAVTTMKPGSQPALLHVRASASGSHELEVSDAYERTHLPVHILSSRPVLLATGDSEMQVLDDDLASELSGSGGASVTGDARQSTAISSPFFFDWPRHAFGQVADHHPDIVAMFLGGNEGFRLGTADCCGDDWSQAYSERVAGMMRTYRQGGAASVYWFLIPTPSKEPFVKVVRAVNRGIISAAAEFPEGVHVFDLRPVFSPGGRYIDSLTHDGRTLTVHEPDGFHLSASADTIVAHMFVERLREDGAL